MLAAKSAKVLGELALDELRAALSLTQEAVAEMLGVKQSSDSKILHGQDMYLSTLDKILRAMGGELEVYVALPDGKVKLSLDQFRNVAKEAERHSTENRSHRAAIAVSPSSIGCILSAHPPSSFVAAISRLGD